ncbi:MAG: FHA domain-containing protein [Gloeomargaritaceae cyanobacterium C42_A2020_066]|nr:FHA domain-containing protein [Gloeomargaritaceae cyanobacterium C42_A2020_066]
MDTQGPERHLLVISDTKGHRVVALEAATYALGRDPTNSIILTGETVSRQHALLIRVPQPEGTYRYRIVDGNTEGKHSRSGLSVNSHPCLDRQLDHEDVIQLGSQVTLHYYRQRMTDEELHRYTESIQFRSIKARPLEATETYFRGSPLATPTDEPEGEALHLSTETPGTSSGVTASGASDTKPDLETTVGEPRPEPAGRWPGWVTGLALGVILGLGGGIGMWWLSQANPPPESPTQPTP